MDVAGEPALEALEADGSRPVRRRWSLAPYDRDLANFLARELHVHPVVGALLVRRGASTADEGKRFLNRRLDALLDPSLLPGAVEAADRIHAAATAGRRICIYGDYDVDGMCAAALLLECLRVGGCAAEFYIPDRFEEGYGVNADALRRLKERGVDLVVTVDCGATSVREAEVARSLGLEYIVTDHHESAGEVPRADAVVHPNLPGSQYPFRRLCGAGVAFKLAWETARRFSGARTTTAAFRKFLLDATSLAAIGTICDVVPLEGENRVLVHHGLKSLQVAPPLGLEKLMQEAGLTKRRRLAAEDVAFQIGPRLNACGRLGQARLGVELLVARDPARAEELARYLESANAQRRTIERRTFLDARAQAARRYSLESGGLPPAFVLDSDEWHPGVVGIVAGRMVERFHRPCILIACNGEEGTGSGRSIQGLHLQQALTACGRHLTNFGGHEMAAGLRIQRNQIDAFRGAFEAEAARRLADERLVADIRIDMEVPLHMLTPKLLDSLDALEPFGAANPKPVFLASDLALVGAPRKIGGGERHLSFRVRQGDRTMRAVAFGHAERIEELADSEGRCCLVFEPIINDFRGYPEVELRVRDFRPGPRME